jgi:hypothetical protein
MAGTGTVARAVVHLADRRILRKLITLTAR